MKKHFFKLLFYFIVSSCLISCASDTEKPSKIESDTPEDQAETTYKDIGGPLSKMNDLKKTKHLTINTGIWSGELRNMIKEWGKENEVIVNFKVTRTDFLTQELMAKGDTTSVDLYIFSEMQQVHEARKNSYLRPVKSTRINSQVNDKYRDPKGMWFALTKFARVIAYRKDKVKPEELSSYEALTDSKWKGRILLPSIAQHDNYAFLASMIFWHDKKKARIWTEGILANAIIEPEGRDHTQFYALGEGKGDIALVSSNIFCKLMNSDDPKDQKIAEKIGIFYPKNEGGGTHTNITVIAASKRAKNHLNVIDFMEYITSKEQQERFAKANFSYPIHLEAKPSAYLQGLGRFIEDDIDFNELVNLSDKAKQVCTQVGWK